MLDGRPHFAREPISYGDYRSKNLVRLYYRALHHKRSQRNFPGNFVEAFDNSICTDWNTAFLGHLAIPDTVRVDFLDRPSGFGDGGGPCGTNLEPFLSALRMFH